ncbi:Na(+)-translocating NADH-quinone reductase subunit F [subsurface metagenome]
MSKFDIIFQPEGKRVDIEEGNTILAAALKSGVDLTSISSGKGICGKCKIIINDITAVNQITTKEMEYLTPAELEDNIRLACLTKVTGNLVVKVPESSRTGKQRLQIEGIDTSIEINPSVIKYYIELGIPTLEDPRSDADRLLEFFQEKHNLSSLQFEYTLLKDLAVLIRENDWRFTITLWKDRIISIEPSNTTDRTFGYAVDIGTTKLAGYLVNLITGKVIAAGSLMNPQVPYGEDVISRLNHPDQKKLQDIVIEGINQILDDLKERTGVKSEEIYEMTAVGNTIMHHLFLGIFPLYVGRSPYPPVVRDSVIVNAENLGVKINPNAKIIFLPTIAGFVGADTVGVVLSTELYKSEDICLAIDIGTNTEVVLGNKHKMLAVSCASGPAFEGAHIKSGMRAASGAIEKIKINPKTLDVEYETIDNEPPIGLCGSGMIDLTAEMVKTGIIDVGGIINRTLHNTQE